MNDLLSTAVSAAIVKNSRKIALAVGAILNLINQEDNLFQGGSIDWLQLNFLVPYCMASYSAARNVIQTRSKLLH